MSGTQTADALGWSQSNYQRLESGTRELKDWEAEALLPKMAELCGVPETWFTAPWGHLPQDGAAATGPDEPEWVGRLEGQLKLILDVLRAGSAAEAQAAMAQLADADPPPAPKRRRRGRTG